MRGGTGTVCESPPWTSPGAVTKHRDAVRVARRASGGNAESGAFWANLLSVLRSVTCQGENVERRRTGGQREHGEFTADTPVGFVPPLPGDGANCGCGSDSSGTSRRSSDGSLPERNRAPSSPSIGISSAAARRRRGFAPHAAKPQHTRFDPARSSSRGGSLLSSASSSASSSSTASFVAARTRSVGSGREGGASDFLATVVAEPAADVDVDTYAEAAASRLAPQRCRNCSGIFVAGAAGAVGLVFCSGECSWSASLQRADRKDESRRRRAAENDRYFRSSSVASSATGGGHGARTMSDLR